MSLAAAALVLIAPPSAPAATFYWNGVGSSGSAGGGSGTWNTTLLNWQTLATAGSATAWPVATDNAAVFAGTAGTVTIDGTVSANALTFSTANYTVTAGVLNLNGTTPTVTNAVAATINSALTGTAGLTKSDNGTLTLGGDNSGLSGTLRITGATAGNNGGVAIGSTAAIGGITAIVIDNNSFLTLASSTIGSSVPITVAGGGGASAPTGAVRGTSGASVVNGAITLADAAVRLGNEGTSTTFNGAITAPVGSGYGISFRTSNNQGTIVTNTANYWEGNTIQGVGSVYFAPGALPATTGLSLAGSGNTWFETNGSFTRVPGAAAGQVAFNSTAGRVNGFSARGGDLTVNLGGAGAALTWGVSSFTPGVLGLAGANATGTLTWVNPINLNTGTQTIDVQNGSADVDARISGALTNGVLTKTGAGTLALSGSNSFTSTTLTFGVASTNLGAIRLENNNALGGVSVIAGNNGTGGAVAQIQLANNVTISGVEYQAGGRSNQTTTGASIVNVSGTNTWAGRIRINNTGGAYGIRSDAGLLVISGTLQNGIGSLRNWDLSGNGDFLVTGQVINGGASALTITKAGSGTLTLSGNNSYTGGTTLSAGVVALGSANALGSAGTISLAGGTLQYSASNTTDYSSRFSTAAGQLYSIDTNGQNVTFSSALASTSGTLTKLGSGTLTLSGTSVTSGSASVSQGTLAITGGLTAAGATASGGTLLVTGSLQAPVTVTGAGTLSGTGSVGSTTVTLGGGLAPGVSGAGTLTLADLVFSNTGSIAVGVQAGAPATLLNVLGGVTTSGGTSSVTFAFGSGLQNIATGTYTLLTYGGTQLANTSAFTWSGVAGPRQGLGLVNDPLAVKFVVASAFPIWSGTAGSNWSATDNWVLNTDDAPTTFIAGDTVVFDDAAATGEVTLSTNVAPGTTTFSGTSLAYSLSGPGGFGITAGALVKSGPAKLTISASNSFSGGTTLSAGTIRIGNESALGSGTISVTGTAAGVTISSDGGTGRTLANAVTVGNDLVLGNATDSGDLTLSGPVSLANGTRTLNTPSSVTLAGTITAGGLVKAGAGSLTLSASNSFNGGSTLSAGTIRIGDNAALGSGTISVTGTAAGMTISSDGGAARTLANALNLGGDLVLGDATNSGTLTLAGPVSLGSGTRTLTTPSNVTITGSITAGGFVKAGAGTLTLSSSNTYSGSTRVGAGTLSLTNAGALAGSTLDMNAADSGNLSFSTITSLSLGGITGSRPVSLQNTGSSAMGLVVGLNNESTSYTGAITGASSIRKIGTGTLTYSPGAAHAATLAGLNIAGGTLELNSGTFTVNGSAGTGQPDSLTGFVVSRGGTFRLNGASVAATAGSYVFPAGNTGGGNSAFILDSGTFSATGVTEVLNAYGANGTFTMNGGLFSANDFRISQSSVGTVNLNGGTLAATRLKYSNSTAAVNFNGGTLRARASVGDLITSNVTVTVKAGGAIIDSNGFNVTIPVALLADGTTGGGLQKTGAGTLTLSASNTYLGSTTVAGGRLAVNGSLAGTSGVTVDAGAELGGSGSIVATIGGAGLVGPGNSPGITTALAVDPTQSLDFAFELTAEGDPTWSNATASVNDVLRLTGGTPFTAPLTPSNVINVYFDVAALATGDTFRGGLFTDATADFVDTVENATFDYYVFGDGGGTVTYNGKSYYLLSSYDGSLSVTVSTPTVLSADFSGGAPVLGGRVMQFAVVPEPGTLALATAAVAGFAAVWGRRRLRAGTAGGRRRA